jgi:hypothetical protein
VLLQPRDDCRESIRLGAQGYVMHTADAAYGASRSMIREIEKGQLVAAAHVEKDVGRGRLVAIRHDARKPHPQLFGIETNRSIEIGADECEVIDSVGWHRPRICQRFSQIASRQFFTAPLVEIEILHDLLRDRKLHAPRVIDKQPLLGSRRRLRTANDLTGHRARRLPVGESDLAIYDRIFVAVGALDESASVSRQIEDHLRRMQL